MSDSIPPKLAEEILDGRCFPFIGAGFSKNAVLPPGKTMPSWNELNRRISKEYRIRYDNSDPTDVPSKLIQKSGKSELCSFLKRELHVEEAKPGEAHALLARLGFKDIYTTNVDTLIEDGLRQASVQCEVIDEDRMFWCSDIPGRTFIIKPHGCLRRCDIVFSRKDFSEYERHRPVMANCLFSQFVSRKPLFIGYSLRDENFNRILRTAWKAMGELRKPGYILVMSPADDEMQRIKKLKISPILLKPTGDTTDTEAVVRWLTTLSKEIESERQLRLACQLPRQHIFRPCRTLCAVMDFGMEGYRDFCVSNILPAVKLHGIEPFIPDTSFSGRGLSSTEVLRAGIRLCSLGVICAQQGCKELQMTVDIFDEFRVRHVIVTPDASAVGKLVRRPTTTLLETAKVKDVRAGLVVAIQEAVGAPSQKVIRSLIKNGNYREAYNRICVSVDLSLRNLLLGRLKKEKNPLLGVVDFYVQNSSKLALALQKMGVVDQDEYKVLRGFLETRACVEEGATDCDASCAEEGLKFAMRWFTLVKGK